MLRQEERKVIEERKADFHSYITEGLSIERSKQLIKESTCLKEVISYVDNF